MSETIRALRVNSGRAEREYLSIGMIAVGWNSLCETRQANWAGLKDGGWERRAHMEGLPDAACMMVVKARAVNYSYVRIREPECSETGRIPSERGDMERREARASLSTEFGGVSGGRRAPPASPFLLALKQYVADEDHVNIRGTRWTSARDLLRLEVESGGETARGRVDAVSDSDTC